MRKGYRREIRGAHGTQHLVDPTGESIAIVNKHSVQVHAIIQSLVEDIKSRDVNNNNELRRALDAIAEEHYQLTTTRQNRFHNWRKKFLADPIWGWLAFLLAVVVAVVGWMN